MKNLIYLSVLFFTVTILFSCQQDYKEVTMHPQDTITKAQYDIWVANWKSHGAGYTNNTLTEYFTMPLIDITEFIQHPGAGSDTVAAARFVLGLDIKTNPADTIPHLVLVGVNSAGESMTDASRGQFIYDVTAPCPNSCGVTSLSK